MNNRQGLLNVLEHTTDNVILFKDGSWEISSGDLMYNLKEAEKRGAIFSIGGQQHSKDKVEKFLEIEKAAKSRGWF
jgi:DNA-binding PadR family transcriptional regulator